MNAQFTCCRTNPTHCLQNNEWCWTLSMRWGSWGGVEIVNSLVTFHTALTHTPRRATTATTIEPQVNIFVQYFCAHFSWFSQLIWIMKAVASLVWFEQIPLLLTYLCTLLSWPQISRSDCSAATVYLHTQLAYIISKCEILKERS